MNHRPRTVTYRRTRWRHFREQLGGQAIVFIMRQKSGLLINNRILHRRIISMTRRHGVITTSGTDSAPCPIIVLLPRVSRLTPTNCHINFLRVARTMASLNHLPIPSFPGRGPILFGQLRCVIILLVRPFSILLGRVRVIHRRVISVTRRQRFILSSGPRGGLCTFIMLLASMGYLTCPYECNHLFRGRYSMVLLFISNLPTTELFPLLLQ